VQALNDLLADSPDPPWTVELLLPNLELADRMAAKVEKLDTVSRAITLSSFVPSEQSEKLEILDDLAFFVEPLPHETTSASKPSTAAAITEAVADVERSLDKQLAASDDAAMQADIRRLRGVLDSVIVRIRSADDGDLEVHRLEKDMLGAVPQWLDNLNAALHPTLVTVDDLPKDLKARYVAADGRARVEVFAKDDLSKPGALDAFVNSLQALDPDSGGFAVEIIESGREVVLALEQAFTIALILVACMVFFLWRSVKDTALVLTSLLLAALMTAAATVALSFPFNFADVIVLPLLLGIGVDSGIHLVHRHRLEGDARTILRSSTARAVLFSALTTIASFGSLGFSTHRGMASLGRLLAVGLVLMLVVNLLLLPALLVVTERSDQV
jgi:predicted RND superfamily exporter protein